MSQVGLDPRLTFESFVSGPANRLATAAAIRVAEAPGIAYNPLVLYAAAGLGKTHLLMAIGNRAATLHPQLRVSYAALESLVAADPASGSNELHHAVDNVDLLLLDDAQFLVGRPDAQDELLHAWDAITSAGGQIVMALDRPPNEIEPLDRRLASRFFSGLVADMAPPDHATRIDIVLRRSAEREHALEPGVAEELARRAFGSVRELQGGLNKVLAVQELEGRQIRTSEVARLLGVEGEARTVAEFGSFLSEVSGAVNEALERLSPDQRIAEAILRLEGEGFRTTRLEAALGTTPTTREAQALVEAFEKDVVRLREITEEIRGLDAAAPELSRHDILRDPDHVAAAEALAVRVRERMGAGSTLAAGNGSGAKPNGSRPHAVDSADRSTAPRREVVPEIGVVDRWFLSNEKVLWRWPYVEDAVVADTD